METDMKHKPTTININGYEVPEPVRSPLERGKTYWIPAIMFYNQMYDNHVWGGDSFDVYFLNRGLIHLTEEAASKHAEALLSFTRIEK